MAAISLSGPPSLLGLPDELKLQIVNYLIQRRDLFNLSLTCRNLEDMVMTRLYQEVDIEIPQGNTQDWASVGLPALRPQVIRLIEELCIRSGPSDCKSAGYSRRKTPDASSIDVYVYDIVNKMPEGQLGRLSYLHRAPMSMRLLDALAARHSNTMRELSFYELETGSMPGMIVPQALTTLECRSIQSGEILGKIVQTNKATLQCLKIGQERELVEQYRRTRIGFLDNIPQPPDSFKNVVQLDNLRNLRHLELFGLDVSSFTPTSRQHALLFCNLERLTLESCLGGADFLETLAGTFYFVRTSPDAPRPRLVPQLKEFLFRNENPTNRLKESLIQFLSAFVGLQTLSLLFENATFLERASTLIAEHGPTLHTLVLESRIQPREHLGLDTSRPFGVGGYSQELWEESINDICRLCPNIVELGTGFPWDDEIVRLRRTRLPSLQQLRTIHIRNFPESHVLSQLGDYSIKEYATKFIEWCFPALVGGSKPALETLAIGPTLYESRWKLNGTRREPPEYLRTHHYCLDWAKTRFGRWSPLITGVGDRYMEELRNQKPLAGVFEQTFGVHIIEISDDEILPPRKRRKSSTPLEIDNTQTTISRTQSSESRDLDKNKNAVKNTTADRDDRFFRSDFQKLTFSTEALPKSQTRTVLNGSSGRHEGAKKISSTRPPLLNGHSGRFPSSEVIRFSPYVVSESPEPLVRNAKKIEPLIPRTGGIKPLPSHVPPSRSQNRREESEKENTSLRRDPPARKQSSSNKPPFSIEIPVRLGSQEVPRQPPYHITQAAQIQVVIPLPRKSVLSQFQGSVPKPEEVQAKRRALLEELKQSTRPAIERSQEVEKFFGNNGFSKAFPTDLDKEILKKAAPLRQRSVNKAKIPLEWSNLEDLADQVSDRLHIVHPKKQVKKLLGARFDKTSSTNLTFANDVNDRRLNGKFQFVDHYILREGVRQADSTRNFGCPCPGQCQRSICRCVFREVKDNKDSTIQVQQGGSYTQRSDGLVVLSEQHIENALNAEAMHFEITECNDFCGCGPDCWNRVVSRGRTVPLEIFETGKYGFGVRSSEHICKGQFIEVYLGEVITERELEKREEAKEESAPSYVYSLDWFNSQYCYHVDGERFGTAMRFVNHSCNPNAKCFTVQTHKTDKNVYRLAFFAIRDIPANTEITIDYSPWEEGEISGELLDDDDEEGRALCYCGAPNCRKVLWRDAGRKRKRRKIRHE